MANKIAGLTIEIGGETTGLAKALGGVNKQSKDLQSELREVDRLLKLDPNNTELITQKQKILADSISNTKEKLNTLKEAERQAQEQFKKGDISEEQYRALQREVIKTETSLKGLESQAIKSNAVLSKEDAVNNLKNMGKAAGVAAVAVGAALVGMTAAAVNNADELQRQADVTGLSAERLQELQYAGNNLGVELDTITGAQAKLTKSMAAAKNGTGAQAEAFKALGINVVDSNGQMRDAKDIMSEAFTALNGVGNETERDALAMQIFGKSAMEMNPLIKAGGDELNRLSKEARDNGAVMSDEAVAGLDAFGDTIDNIKTSFLGSFGEALAGILPDIQTFLNNLMNLPKWIKENSTLLEIIGVAIGTITALVIAFNIQQALAGTGMTLWSVIAGVGTTITTALGAAFAFLTSPIGLVILAIGAVIAIGILLYKNWDTIKAYAIEIWTAISTFFVETFTSIGEWFTKTWTGIKDFFVEIWNGIKEFFSSTLESVKTIAKDKFGFIFDSIRKIFDSFKLLFQGDFKGFITGIWDAAVTWAAGWLDIGKNIVTGIWDGIQAMASWLWDKVTGFFSGILDGVKDVLGIHSPSTVFADVIGKNMALGIGMGFENEMKNVAIKMNKSISVELNIPEDGGNSSGSSSKGGSIGGITQNVNIYSPSPLSPSEVARQTRNASRRLALGVK